MPWTPCFIPWHRRYPCASPAQVFRRESSLVGGGGVLGTLAAYGLVFALVYLQTAGDFAALLKIPDNTLTVSCLSQLLPES
jgi:hypothetical protein